MPSWNSYFTWKRDWCKSQNFSFSFESSDLRNLNWCSLHTHNSHDDTSWSNGFHGGTELLPSLSLLLLLKSRRAFSACNPLHFEVEKVKASDVLENEGISILLYFFFFFLAHHSVSCRHCYCAALTTTNSLPLSLSLSLSPLSLTLSHILLSVYKLRVQIVFLSFLPRTNSVCKF